MRVNWTLVVRKDYDSAGVPWGDDTYAMSGLVQGYVSVDGTVHAVILVDWKDGECLEYLDSVPLSDLFDARKDDGVAL